MGEFVQNSGVLGSTWDFAEGHLAVPAETLYRDSLRREKPEILTTGILAWGNLTMQKIPGAALENLPKSAHKIKPEVA